MLKFQTVSFLAVGTTVVDVAIHHELYFGSCLHNEKVSNFKLHDNVVPSISEYSRAGNEQRKKKSLARQNSDLL